MLNQKLQQRLLQKLSPQQVLVLRLLQEPILSLEQRIKQEIEENPALEETSEPDEESESILEEPTLESIDSDEDELTSEEPVNKEDEFSFEDYIDEDEIPEYRLTINNSSPDEQSREIPVVSRITSQDFLLAQLGMHQLTDKQFIIAATIIGNLDEAGYLRRETYALIDDLAFNQNIEVTPEEVESTIRLIQEFDPPGIGARDLQECLLLQLNRLPNHTKHKKLATGIISEYFSEFSKKHYGKIILKAKISEEELREAADLIKSLNPKPGGDIAEGFRENQYIIPDFMISNTNGELELMLNSRNIPDLILSRQYLDMLQSYSRNKSTVTKSERAALTFIKQKLDSAKGFIDAIRQRQETLYTTMTAIMNYQSEYFLTGDETKLRPMILKDISAIVDLDISTISRVANSKYVQTPFGTFLLKSFFSESMQNTKGEEVSTREIKKILQDLIEAENKSSPYTDEELVDILNKKGYNIARRTISKYRKKLNIPVARLRINI